MISFKGIKILFLKAMVKMVVADGDDDDDE
jgi:hypothetical protein